jgi:hypothetical protein
MTPLMTSCTPDCTSLLVSSRLGPAAATQTTRCIRLGSTSGLIELTPSSFHRPSHLQIDSQGGHRGILQIAPFRQVDVLGNDELDAQG